MTLLHPLVVVNEAYASVEGRCASVLVASGGLHRAGGEVEFLSAAGQDPHPLVRMMRVLAGADANRKLDEEPMTVEAFQAMPAAERKLQTTPWATAQILLKQARHT
jgi:hypothetical protein